LRTIKANATIMVLPVLSNFVRMEATA
jgi:hypothetical protein